MEDTKTDERPLEKSPQGRYVRFGTRLGSGAYKTVYKAYDTDQGIDVAWNAIDIASLPTGEKSRIIQEVQLLQKLEHKNIINFYGSWFSKEKNQVVFITEIMTSGTLKSYIKRVQFVKWKIIKRWCIQILEGLEYLHSQNPPIIHRDLKCDNIFINGNTGDLRIGDLGLSTQMAVEQRAQSVLGTPEFMAPELYDENYDEKVDIYAFGMCVLEMVTKEVPYSECMNPAQIYKKVIAGIRPQGLQRIISDSARNFIELCLSRGGGKVDVTAVYLLKHPFLQPSENDDDHDLVYPLDEHTVETTIEPEPSNEELQKELDMECSKNDESDRRSSAPNMTVETDPSSGNAHLTYEAKDIANQLPSKSNIEEKPHIETTEISEPISGEVTDDYKADEILASMPGNEANVQNARIDVMDGRRQRRVKSERADDTTDKGETEKRAQSMVDPGRSQHKPLREHASSVPDLENMPPRPRIPRTQEEAKAADKNESQAKTTGEYVDEGKGTDEMVLRKRGNRHDIRATEDPEHEYSIMLNLRIVIDGKTKEIKFPFNLFTDVPHEVASELAADVGIPEPELGDIIDSIAFLVTEGKIKNLEKMHFDVWEDAPEPYSFVKKGTSSNPLAATKKKEIASAIDAPPVPSNVMRSVSANTGSSDGSTVGTGTSLPEISRDDAAAVAAAAILQGVPHPNGLHSNSRHSKANSTNGSPPPDSFDLEDTNADESNADYVRKMRNYEGRLQIAQSAFDQREMSLEAAIRSEEEKHKREMERYRKKMEEFERKKQKAALARMQRMEQVAAEFKAEVEAERKKWDSSRQQGVQHQDTPSISSVPSNSDTSVPAASTAVVSAPPTMQQSS